MPRNRPRRNLRVTTQSRDIRVLEIPANKKQQTEYTIQYIPQENTSTDIFNCSLVVKKKNGEYTFYYDPADGDTLLLMYREMTQQKSNNIMIADYDISLNTLDTIYPVVKNAKLGSYEDARFFVYNNALGLSYTYKLTMGMSLLNELYSIDSHDIIPFAKYFPPPEKNWTFFEKDGRLFGIRYYCPLEIYEIDLEKKLFIPYIKWEWKYPIILRGGTPPVLLNNKYYMVLHSAGSYYMYTLVIDAETFMPLEISSMSLIRDIDTTFQFPCGLVYDIRTHEWIISLGINDIHCAIVRFKTENMNLEDITTAINDTKFTKYQIRDCTISEQTETELLMQEIKLLRKEVERLRKDIISHS